MTKPKLIDKPKDDIPEKPGVYLFKSSDKVLYIGKAKNLKKRVLQYFQKREHAVIHNLLAQADDIEYIVTDDEKDALLLEFNLVHRYYPPFNIRLKDDKSFPFIEITAEDDFPGIYFTRRTTGKNIYIGPLVNSRKARELIDIVTRLFKLRTCSPPKFSLHSACLYFHIERCSGPCINLITPTEYREKVSGAIDLLKGNKTKIANLLKEQMLSKSSDLKFEEAQKLKEDLDTINQFVLESYISSAKKMDIDVVALHYDPVENECFIILFAVQEGKIQRKEFLDFDTLSTQKEDILKEFLVGFYHKENIPREIAVQFLPSDRNSIEEIFSRIAGFPVRIKLPLKGYKRKIMDLAVKNLNLFVYKNKYHIVGEQLRTLLHLQHYPNLIEGYDISHFSERERVGAVVVFVKGKPLKKEYRNYIIREAAPGDTEAIKEVLERRFRDRNEADQPDLLLIDGGKPQLSAAISVKQRLKIRPDIVSLAKEEERVYLEHGGSLVFEEGSPLQFLFQNIRDEVHRRAVTHHRKRREKIG